MLTYFYYFMLTYFYYCLELEDLLRSMLNKNPEERCTVSQLMNHPWLNQIVPIMNYNFADIIDCGDYNLLP